MAHPRQNLFWDPVLAIDCNITVLYSVRTAEKCRWVLLILPKTIAVSLAHFRPESRKKLLGMIKKLTDDGTCSAILEGGRFLWSSNVHFSGKFLFFSENPGFGWDFYYISLLKYTSYKTRASNSSEWGKIIHLQIVSFF